MLIWTIRQFARCRCKSYFSFWTVSSLPPRPPLWACAEFARYSQKKKNLGDPYRTPVRHPRQSSVRPLLKSGLGFERGPRGRERRRGKLARRRAFPHRQGKPPFSACPLQKTPNFRVNTGNVGPTSGPPPSRASQRGARATMHGVPPAPLGGVVQPACT